MYNEDYRRGREDAERLNRELNDWKRWREDFDSRKKAAEDAKKQIEAMDKSTMSNEQYRRLLRESEFRPTANDSMRLIGEASTDITKPIIECVVIFIISSFLHLGAWGLAICAYIMFAHIYTTHYKKEKPAVAKKKKPITLSWVLKACIVAVVMYYLFQMAYALAS